MKHSTAVVTKNALALTALKLVSPALSVVVVLAVSRMLGAEGLGRYTLATTFLGVVTTLTPLGLNAFLMREGARTGDSFPKLFANAVGLTVTVSVLVTLLFPMVGFWLGYDAVTRQALTVLSLAIVPATLLVLCDAVFISHHRSWYIGIYTMVDLVIRVGVGTWLLFHGHDVVALIGVLVAAQWAAFAVAAHLARRLGAPLRINVDRAILGRLIRTAPTFLSISVFATMAWNIDVVMLSKFASLHDVGLYGAAYRIFDMIRILPQCLCMAVYPLVSQAAGVDLADVRRIGSETLRLMWMALIPIAVGGTLIAGPLLAFTVGEEFRSAGTTLAILLWTTVPYTFVRYYSYVTVAANRERVDLLLNVGLSATNIGLNIVLIPRYGALGAAVATLVSMCAFGLAQYLYVSTRLSGYLAPLPRLSKPAAAAAIMALFVWMRRTDQVVLLIGAAGLVYITLLLLTRSLSLEELRLWRRGGLAEPESL
jgi:O-antigen/teichoic acid export membrane protein